jgi:cytochrome d ubiquinol oxidase subunit II
MHLPTAAEGCAAALVASLVLYAIFGGADFGGGVLDLLARGPRKAAQRAAIERAMGPVWEANHVWLIFVIVLLFTAFPPAFAALSTALFLPFHGVLVGITLRGAAFVFRHYAPRRTAHTRALGVVFGAASVITPLLLGACLGAVSSGRLRVDPTGDLVHFEGSAPLLAPISIATAFAALSLCAYLAAVFLVVETEGALREDFRRRALMLAGVVLVGAIATLPLAAREAPALFRGLSRPRTLPIVLAGGVAAAVSVGALLARRPRLARIAASAEVALLIVGWASALFPYVIYPDVTIADAAASEPTLRFVLAALPCGAALLIPSLWLLFRVFRPAPTPPDPAAVAVDRTTD